MSTADAVAREVAWLNTFGDGLPALVDPNGPWGIVQAYEPRVAAKRKSGIYVRRPEFTVKRFANVRSMTTYNFLLNLVWPLTSGTGSAEVDQQSFDTAVDLLLGRIYGFIGDKTHGGRFLSVAEAPAMIVVTQQDPDVTIASSGSLLGQVMYSADDNEFPN